MHGDGYGHDVAVNPAKYVLTSSFAGFQNYMRNLGDLIKDSAAMKHFRRHDGGVESEVQAADSGSVACQRDRHDRDPTKIPLPVDISITADGRGLWVNTFMDGTTHYFDISDPEHPEEVYAKHTGSQVNMISQSWDGKRIYIASSLLANWDQRGADNQQFLRVFNWDGHALTPAFELDFLKEKTWPPAPHEIHRPGKRFTESRCSHPPVRKCATG